MKKISLRFGLVSAILICWLMPILIIVTISGVLLNNNYRDSIQQEIRSEADSALRQVQMHIEDTIWDSKAVSYDGIIRSAYRGFLEDGDSALLYRSVNDYLTQNFARESGYRAAFLRFWKDGADASAYVLCRGTTGHDLLKQCQNIAPDIVEAMEDADTDIRFLYRDDQLYMARNLLDNRFQPYATFVILLEPEVIFQSLEAIGRADSMQIRIDECTIPLTGEEAPSGSEEIRYSLNADDHTLVFTAYPRAYNIWDDTPWLRGAVAGAALMVLPLLLVMIGLFYRHVTSPMEALARANVQVQSGERGYQITQKAPNTEFEKLYRNFNTMSSELKNQFERTYQEQQATQKAQIKALQSQINPHFLNNTLEIISWEVRLADNERVCAMIEALSTMLTAALDRDGRTQIPLSEELGYVEAYLYIIRERLGGALQIRQEIAPEMKDQLIPRLILQPIVENAVEHDITANRGGRLVLRAWQDDRLVFLEVEHDGTMTDDDRENIRRQALAEDPGKGRVGLRNVFRRLKLLYGEDGALTIDEVTPGTILARISFPKNP